MGERRIGLSTFEALLHQRHRKVTLGSEIGDCFEYFDQHTPKVLGDKPIILIHGSKIELRKVGEGKGYAVEMDGVTRIVGVDNISRQEQLEMVRRIRNITFPYAEHVKTKLKRS